MGKFFLLAGGAFISLTMATSAVAIGPPFPDETFSSEREIVSAISTGRPLSSKFKWAANATVAENGHVIGQGRSAPSALQRYENGMSIYIEHISYGEDSLMIVATIKSRTLASALGITECCTWASVMRFDLNKQGQIKALSIMEQRNGSWESPPASAEKAK